MLWQPADVSPNAAMMLQGAQELMAEKRVVGSLKDVPILKKDSFYAVGDPKSHSKRFS